MKSMGSRPWCCAQHSETKQGKAKREKTRRGGVARVELPALSLIGTLGIQTHQQLLRTDLRMDER